jgi:hypothetical protein
LLALLGILNQFSMVRAKATVKEQGDG